MGKHLDMEKFEQKDAVVLVHLLKVYCRFPIAKAMMLLHHEK